jgi:hypothetical protein
MNNINENNLTLSELDEMSMRDEQEEKINRDNCGKCYFGNFENCDVCNECDGVNKYRQEDKCIQCQHYNTRYCDDWCDNHVLFEPIQKPTGKKILQEEEHPDCKKLLEEARDEYDNWYESVYAGSESVVRLKEKYEQVTSLREKEINKLNNELKNMNISFSELSKINDRLQEQLKTKQIDDDIIELLTYLSDIENYTFKEHFLLVKEETEKFKRLLQQLNEE